MARNDWINSYLNAILDVDPGISDSKANPSLLLRERGRFSPARYFVEEVITGFDETDLHRSWARVRTLVITMLNIYVYNRCVSTTTISMVYCRVIDFIMLYS